jgi:hypothetical protein
MSKKSALLKGQAPLTGQPLTYTRFAAPERKVHEPAGFCARLVHVCIICAAAGVAFSCTNFFSTSLASWAARDPSSLIPPVSANNVNDLIAESENNPDMSLAVLEKIRDTIDGAGEDEASSLRAAALKAAANASGLGPALMSQMDQISAVVENTEKAQELVMNTLNDMTNIEAAGAALAGALPPPGTAAFDAFVEKSNSSDLATAAAVLLASEAKGKVDDENYIKNFDPSSPDVSDSALLAVELAKAASQKIDEEGSNSRFKDILEGLNLAPSSGAKIS